MAVDHVRLEVEEVQPLSRVRNPTAPEAAVPQAVEIESTDGSRTLLRFCSPMLIEMLTFGDAELAAVASRR